MLLFYLHRPLQCLYGGIHEVYSLLNRFGFDVIFHAAKVVLLCDINVDNLSRKNSRIGRFVQFCILYLPKGIKNSPSSEELSEILARSKLQYTIIAL